MPGASMAIGLALRQQRNSSRGLGCAIGPGRGGTDPDPVGGTGFRRRLYLAPDHPEPHRQPCGERQDPLGDDWQLSATAYVRALRQRHLDGNDADFESCSTKGSYGGDLCLQDDGFPRAGRRQDRGLAQPVHHRQPAGQVFPFNSSVVYGTDDRTFTDTVTQGATLQLTGTAPLLGLGNYFTAGGSVDHSAIGYRSTARWARSCPISMSRSLPGLAGAGIIVHTMGDLGYAPADLAGTTDYYGLYAVDALDLTPALTLTAGARLNVADYATRDRSGEFPELTGSHGYTHLNPLAGLTYELGDGITFSAAIPRPIAPQRRWSWTAPSQCPACWKIRWFPTRAETGGGRDG